MKYYDDDGNEVNERQYFSCVKKIRFRTKQSANNQLRDINKRKKGGSSSLTIYECNYCDGFHVGNLVSKKARKIIR